MVIMETENLSYTYPDGTKAIDDISISLREGERISFVGRNGSGKSTLFLLLNGTLRPTGGRILYRGEEIGYGHSELRDLRKKVGIVFQNSDDQIFAPTVYQDIAFGPVNLGYSEEETEKVVNRMLDYFGIRNLKDKPPHHLSGGQKKRVAIAGILAMDPDIIILDEPLSNLDPLGADEILGILNELNHFGKTVIISTHDVDLAYRWSDTVYLLSKGKLVDSGKAEDVFRKEKQVRESSLKTPVIAEIYKELKKRWLVPSGLSPKTIPELIQPLRTPDLLRVEAPADVKVGECVNMGVLFSNYDEDGIYEAVNSRVLFRNDDGTVVAEVHKKVLKPGAVYVYDTDIFDRQSFDAFVAEHDIGFICTMGKTCQTLAEAEHIPISAYSGVIDKCILNSLSGCRCLILAHGGMVGYSFEKLKEYSGQSGIRLRCGLANRAEDDEAIIPGKKHRKTNQDVACDNCRPE